MLGRQTHDAILIVDDDVDFARGLGRLITKGFPGQAVLVKHDGPSALALLQERPCALMITDMRMPGMDGLRSWNKFASYRRRCRSSCLRASAPSTWRYRP